MKDITLVLTSCGRLDLLQKTVNSIKPEILKSIKQNILIDDSGNRSVYNSLDSNSTFSNWKKIYNEFNIGLPKSVDLAYSFVDSKYIFHCEDDWYFDCHYDFISESIKILENNKNIFQVTFRKNDPHPLQPTQNGYSTKIPKWMGIWYGFTYNPSVLRFSDVKKVLPYAGKYEQQISEIYYSMGLLTVAINGVVSHLGEGRSTHPYLKL